MLAQLLAVNLHVPSTRSRLWPTIPAGPDGQSFRLLVDILKTPIPGSEAPRDGLNNMKMRAAIQVVDSDAYAVRPQP